MGTGASTWLLNCVDGTPINGIDEMAPDDAGGIYCGTADLDAIIKGEAPGAAALYRLAADGVLHVANGPLGFANGMALSANGQTFFLNENFDGTYAASKESIRALTKTAAKEWGRLGIRVNTILPAALSPKAVSYLKESNSFDAELAKVAIGRFGAPEDVAPTAILFASDASSCVTRQTIGVDGGPTML